jgi:ribosome recycling factor
LGLTPVIDAKIIRVSIPPLTEQRRMELVKVIKKMAESSKVSIRNHRRDINEELKQLKKDKAVSEDDFFKGQKEVQELTDDYIKICDELTQVKEKEVLEF